MTTPRRGRPPFPLPPDCNPWADTLSAIAAREGVSVPTVQRWRRETPDTRPKPVEKAKATRGQRSRRRSDLLDCPPPLPRSQCGGV